MDKTIQKLWVWTKFIVFSPSFSLSPTQISHLGFLGINNVNFSLTAPHKALIQIIPRVQQDIFITYIHHNITQYFRKVCNITTINSPALFFCSPIISYHPESETRLSWFWQFHQKFLKDWSIHRPFPKSSIQRNFYPQVRLVHLIWSYPRLLKRDRGVIPRATDEFWMNETWV